MTKKQNKNMHHSCITLHHQHILNVHLKVNAAGLAHIYSHLYLVL